MSDLQHQRLAELSRELRLSAVPDLYSAIAQSAAAKAASFADFLEGVLRAERDARRARAREMFARVAGFPAIKTLDGFDFGFATGAPRAQVHELASLAWIERAENIVFQPSSHRFINDSRSSGGVVNSRSRFRSGFSPSLARKSVQRERMLPAMCLTMTAMLFEPGSI